MDLITQVLSKKRIQKGALLNQIIDTWILKAGSWNDTGLWNDTKIWID